MQTGANAFRMAFLLAILTLVLCWSMLPPKNGDLLASGPSSAAAKGGQARGKLADPRLNPAYRFEKGGWVYVHLEGTPGQIGFQHGYLLAPEIADAFEAVKLQDTHSTKKDWDFFRKAAHEMLWPKIDQECQEELEESARA